MKSSVFFIVSVLFCGGFLSCSKTHHENESEFSRFIFGHFYGFCQGEGCIEIFKLEDGVLYEDTLDMYPSRDEFYNGSYVRLSNDAYLSVKDLPDFFPAKLWDENKKVLGMPDSGDWGGLYIEVIHGPHRQFWIIDQHKSNVDSSYHTFIDQVNDKIRKLR